jgi:hypothetical protein
MTNETRSIESTDIVDFTFKIQQAILDGYRLSDSSDLSPQCIGFVYVTTMEKAENNPMPIGDLSLAITVDTEQALAEIAKIAQETGQYDMTPEQQDKAVVVVKENTSVEVSPVEPKQQQRRGRQSK